MTVSQDTPRYVFLMRHAKHDQGQLTVEGLAHIRSLAARFSEWVQAEWRTQPERTVRLWCTSTSAEVQETADMLTRDVLVHVRQGEGENEHYPFACPLPGEPAMGRPDNGRQPWMPALIPASATAGRDPGKVLSAYSPDKLAFRALCAWLEANRAGLDQARRTGTDVPLVVGNDPLIGWAASKLTGRDTPVARGTDLPCQ